MEVRAIVVRSAVVARPISCRGTSMKKPILNIDDVEFEAHVHGTSFVVRIAPVANQLGARLLGARVVVIPPGKKAWPRAGWIAMALASRPAGDGGA